MRDKLCAALDVTSETEAVTLMDKLSRTGLGWVKIGPSLLTKPCGPNLLREASERDFRVFADYKFKDIPSVVAKGISNLVGIADLVTVHIDGGREMLKAAKNAAGHSMLVIGVTLLTSLNWKDLRDFNIPVNEEAVVEAMARIAQESGIDGVVSSARELARLKEFSPPEFFFVTPGLKVGVNECDYREEQKRDADPRWAYQQGSDLLVMGRDIYQAEDPAKRINEIEKWCLGN